MVMSFGCGGCYFLDLVTWVVIFNILSVQMWYFASCLALNEITANPYTPSIIRFVLVAIAKINNDDDDLTKKERPKKKKKNNTNTHIRYTHTHHKKKKKKQQTKTSASIFGMEDWTKENKQINWGSSAEEETTSCEQVNSFESIIPILIQFSIINRLILDIITTRHEVRFHFQKFSTLIFRVSCRVAG